MKRLVGFLLVCVVVFCAFITMDAFSCYQAWNEKVSAVRCPTHIADCTKNVYSAALHKCCVTALGGYVNCPLGDNWNGAFSDHIGGQCQGIPCSGMSGSYCVGGTNLGTTGWTGWVPNDIPNTSGCLVV